MLKMERTCALRKPENLDDCCSSSQIESGSKVIRGVDRAGHKGMQTALLSWASKILGPYFILFFEYAACKELIHILKMCQ